MILATHAVVGAALAQEFPQQPTLGFLIAFLSHFLLDAIPHWQYGLKSFRRDASDYLNNDMQLGRDFVIDLGRTGSDFFLGIILSLLLFSPSHFSPLITLLGVLGGILPDAFQLVYWKLRVEPLRTLQRFHVGFIHSKKHIAAPLPGIISQALIAVAIVFLLKTLS